MLDRGKMDKRSINFQNKNNCFIINSSFHYESLYKFLQTFNGKGIELYIYIYTFIHIYIYMHAYNVKS